VSGKPQRRSCIIAACITLPYRDSAVPVTLTLTLIYSPTYSHRHPLHIVLLDTMSLRASEFAPYVSSFFSCKAYHSRRFPHALNRLST